MTQFLYYDDVDLGNQAVRLGGLPGFTTVADGAAVSFGGFVVDDPGSTRTLVGLQKFAIDETACTPKRMWTGYALARTVKRGPFVVGSDRVWDVTVGDINMALQFRVIRGANAKRPAETDVARLAWLLTTDSLSGLVYNNGGVNLTDNIQTLDAADYRGQYANDVLRDIGSVLFGKQFFCYWDSTVATGHEISLFYDVPTASYRTSSLSLSNVLADYNGTTVFAPSIDAQLVRDPQDTWSGIYETYSNGIIYENFAATEAAFIRREIAVNQSRIGLLTTASSYATQFLARFASEQDTITCTVQLPSSKVNLIGSGMRLQCKFSHLPGYGAYSYLRVTRITVSQTILDPDLYDVALELSNRAPFGTAGGGGSGNPPPPTVFPNPPAAQAHYYMGHMTDSAPTFGPDPPGADFTDTIWTNATSYDYSITVNSLTASPGGVTFRLYYPGDVAYFWSINIPTVTTYTGTFATPGALSNPLGHAWLQILHNDIAPGLVDIDFWIDPVGWVTPTVQPPAPGQWVLGEVITMSGANGTTAWPFAAGSLTVYVDNLDQTPSVTAQDGAAGTFTLAFTPTTGEVVTVKYQGL